MSDIDITKDCMIPSGYTTKKRWKAVENLDLALDFPPNLYQKYMI